MAHTRTWNAAYEAGPADSQALSQGAARIRELKTDIRERLDLDHIMDDDDTNDGRHRLVTLLVQSDPTVPASTGVVYTKDVSSKGELHYRDEDNNVIILTSVGQAWVIQNSNTWTAGQATLESTITYAATITPDASVSNAFVCALTGNVTLALPTNGISGQVLTIRLAQDGTGSRLLTPNASYKKPAGLSLTLSTGASEEDLLILQYFNTTWVILNLLKDIKTAV